MNVLVVGSRTVGIPPPNPTASERSYADRQTHAVQSTLDGILVTARNNGLTPLQIYTCGSGHTAVIAATWTRGYPDVVSTALLGRTSNKVLLVQAAPDKVVVFSNQPLTDQPALADLATQARAVQIETWVLDLS